MSTKLQLLFYVNKRDEGILSGGMAEIINTLINREKVLLNVQARGWDSGAGPRVNQRPGHRGWFS